MSDILFYIFAINAIALMIAGIVIAAFIITGREAGDFAGRIMRSTIVLVLTSLAAGTILWVGDYLFIA